MFFGFHMNSKNILDTLSSFWLFSHLSSEISIRLRNEKFFDFHIFPPNSLNLYFYWEIHVALWTSSCRKLLWVLFQKNQSVLFPKVEYTAIWFCDLNEKLKVHPFCCTLYLHLDTKEFVSANFVSSLVSCKSVRAINSFSHFKRSSHSYLLVYVLSVLKNTFWSRERV